jgi:hypothetical protein
VGLACLGRWAFGCMPGRSAPFLSKGRVCIHLVVFLVGGSDAGWVLCPALIARCLTFCTMEFSWPAVGRSYSGNPSRVRSHLAFDLWSKWVLRLFVKGKMHCLCACGMCHFKLKLLINSLPIYVRCVNLGFQSFGQRGLHRVYTCACMLACCGILAQASELRFAPGFLREAWRMDCVSW